jgi:hypothetical protein
MAVKAVVEERSGRARLGTKRGEGWVGEEWWCRGALL